MIKYMHNPKIGHFISLQGLMSRRAAERAIEDGRVKVNGEIARCAMRYNEDDEVMLDNNLVAKQKPRLYMFHKPPMYLVSHKSTDGKKTIFDLLRKHNLGHLTFCGRLDYLSEGLLLLTNDPSFAHQLTTSELKRTYVVQVDRIDPKLAQFCKNPYLDDEKLKPIDFIAKDDHIILGLYEGKNREIRRIMKLFDMKIGYLKRTAYGPFKCDIPMGKIVEIDIPGSL